MTIDEAIEILRDLDTTLSQSDPELRREAVQLGIAALRAIQMAREGAHVAFKLPLPGETKKQVRRQ